MEDHFLFLTLRTMCMDGATEAIGNYFEATFTFAYTRLKRAHRTCHPWICKTVTFISWILLNIKQQKAKLLKEKIQHQHARCFFLKKAHLSDSVCFHDKINFLEVTITEGSDVYHSTRMLSLGVYRCFIPTKQKIAKKLLGYIKRKA